MTKNDLDTRRAKTTARIVTRLAGIYDRKLHGTNSSTSNISKSQKSLLIQLELDGTRVSVLAKRLGISKQAVSRTAQELEEKGFVNRIEDETDGRATMLCFTERGRKLVATTVDKLEAFEHEMVSVLGAKDAEKLNQLLDRWAKHFDPHSF